MCETRLGGRFSRRLGGRLGGLSGGNFSGRPAWILPEGKLATGMEFAGRLTLGLDFAGGGHGCA